MNITLDLKKVLILAGSLLLVLVGIAAAFTISHNSYEKRIVELQNESAAKDTTIETQKDVYQKLTLQDKDLEDLLTSKDGDITRLKQQLDATGAQLLTANTVAVQLRKTLTATGKVKVVSDQPDHLVPASGTTAIPTTELEDAEDMGPFHVICDLLIPGVINPDLVIAKLSLSQAKPFSLSVVVSQDKDGTWRTSTASSDDSFKVDIALAAVNPYLLQPKWYEKISFSADLGISTNPGLLAGVGASYEIGKFEVGPKVWVVLDHGASPYYGAGLTWHPFMK